MMKKLMLGVMTLSFVFMFAGASSAAMEWGCCKIAQIGVAADSLNLLKVTSCNDCKTPPGAVTKNEGKWLELVKQKDTSMATMLTAFSMDRELKLNADFDAGTTTGSVNGPVEVIYLRQ